MACGSVVWTVQGPNPVQLVGNLRGKAIQSAPLQYCRLAKAAKDGGAKLAIVTAGPTRADSLLGSGDVKLQTLAGPSISRLAAHPWLLVPPGC